MSVHARGCVFVRVRMMCAGLHENVAVPCTPLACVHQLLQLDPTSCTFTSSLADAPFAERGLGFGWAGGWVPCPLWSSALFERLGRWWVGCRLPAPLALHPPVLSFEAQSLCAGAWRNCITFFIDFAL